MKEWLCYSLYFYDFHVFSTAENKIFVNLFHLIGLTEGFSIEAHLPLVAFLKLTRLSEAVCLIVKEDNTVFKKKVAIDNTTDDKVLFTSVIFCQHGKWRFATQLITVS